MLKRLYSVSIHRAHRLTIACLSDDIRILPIALGDHGRVDL